jgi:CheY-like chemotaxis protein
MNPKDAVYPMLRSVVNSLAESDPSIRKMPDSMDPGTLLSEIGIDATNLPEILAELKERLAGKELKLGRLFDSEELNQSTVGELVGVVMSNLEGSPYRKIVVYVDDEEENLFVFKRRFQKKLDIVTFSDPREALAYIQSNPSVGLVITDEVMPGLGGNQLCDEVKKVKPFMKFILITGNPDQDDNLMYRTLRGSRFYDYLQKPVDFESRGEEILNTITGLIEFNW